MALKLMYITNRPDIAQIAETAGVDRIFIDMEFIGKSVRQGGMDTVQNHHTLDDVKIISESIESAELLVRVNPIHEKTENYISSEEEINRAIENGAKILMLPYFKTVEEVRTFINIVAGRAKVMPLVETPEAVDKIDEILDLDGLDEIFIGLNDLSLGYGKKFMFELLSDGTVEDLCYKFRKAGIPFGFGGIAAIGKGELPAEKIITEHYRLGSTCAILSRSFCNVDRIKHMGVISETFFNGVREIRDYEKEVAVHSSFFAQNKEEIKKTIKKNNIVLRDDVSGDKELKMNITPNALKKLRCDCGEAFYLLDSTQFRRNFLELKEAFSSIYPNFNIAYSYKTNYTPKLCKIVNELGGYAEVVSEMEMELALRCGVECSRIIWNGPIKDKKRMREFLLAGGAVNIDSISEAEYIKELASIADHKLNVGIRCNYDVDDGVVSRFGFDVDGEDFKRVLGIVTTTPNLHFINFQCHFAKRQIEYWPARAKGMVELLDRVGVIPERVDIGGGLFGKMADSLKAQFVCKIPEYKEYATAAASVFTEYFKGKEKTPELIIEPGSAIVGDCMKFVGTVKTIKNVRGKYFASVLGSQKNISMAGINPPMEVVHMSAGKEYENLDLVGFTCIEGDILYKNYSGELAVGDAIVISNCGSYSLVMKPPFILPNFPVLDICGDEVEVIKRAETFDDIFHTFNY